MNISVLGCGRWGSFLAWYHSAKNDVTLWGREGSRSLAALRETGGNRYLKLPERVCLTSDLGAALESAQLVVISISAQESRAGAMHSGLSCGGQNVYPLYERPRMWYRRPADAGVP